jgi:hypothetical protein
MTEELASKSPLYAAATEALVSEHSAESTFEKMIAVAYSHATEQTFQEEVKKTEAIIKAEYEISSMPGPWRSAKSVLMSAMKLNIDMVDDNGGFVGKTFLQNKIKEKKMEDKDPPTIQEYADQMIRKLNAPPEGIDPKSLFVLVLDHFKGKYAL